MIPNEFEPRPSSILIVDDDPTACRILEKILRKGGFTVEVLNSGVLALARMSMPDAPKILLLDWLMPDLSGLEVCRELRSSSHGTNPYIFLISKLQSDTDTLHCFEAGIDEFIAKPFDPQLLLARVQSAQRRLHTEDPRGRQGFMELLQQASQQSTGEVIVRGLDRSGRVVFYQGKVAWVHLSGGLPILPMLLELGLTEEDARNLLQECQIKRLPFLDMLSEWGLISQEKLREYFREELSNRLALLSNANSLSSFFVPEQAKLQSHLLYDLSELLPATPEHLFRSRSHSVLPPRPPPAQFIDLQQQILAVDGVQCTGLIDLENSLISGCDKPLCNESLARRITRIFQAESRQEFEEIMMVNADSYHIARSLPNSWLFYVHVNRDKNPNLALLRLKMSPPQS